MWVLENRETTRLYGVTRCYVEFANNFESGTHVPGPCHSRSRILCFDHPAAPVEYGRLLSISWMISVGVGLTAKKGGLRLTASFSFSILTKHLHLESFKAAGNASEDWSQFVFPFSLQWCEVGATVQNRLYFGKMLFRLCSSKARLNKICHFLELFITAILVLLSLASCTSGQFSGCMCEVA